MKNFILTIFLCLSFSQLDARENPYDLVGKSLAPFVNLLSAKNSGHSATADFTLIEMTGLPPENAGFLLHVSMENPDKLCLNGTFMGAQATLCRNGRQIWVTPGSALSLLLNQLPPVTSNKPESPLGNFVLGIPDNQLAFLPALFQVKEENDATINGESCRVLHLVLIPELARSTGMTDCSARIWVRPGYKLARLELIKPNWHLTLGIDHLEFNQKIPASTWQPPTDPAADALQIDPVKIKQLFDFITPATKPK